MRQIKGVVKTPKRNLVLWQDVLNLEMFYPTPHRSKKDASRVIPKLSLQSWVSRCARGTPHPTLPDPTWVGSTGGASRQARLETEPRISPALCVGSIYCIRLMKRDNLKQLFLLKKQGHEMKMT